MNDRPRPPPGLRGRQLGLWYRDRGREKKRAHSVPHVPAADPQLEQNICEQLTSMASAVCETAGSARDHCQSNWDNVSRRVEHRSAQAEQAVHNSGGVSCSAAGLQDGGGYCSATSAVTSSPVGCDRDSRRKYQHLADNKFRRQFFANLAGNQQCVWNNLTYDASTDGVARCAHIDSLLLAKCQPVQDDNSELSQFRRQLPAASVKQRLLRVISEHQVVVLSGDTGCGKTTQVAQYILEQWSQEARGSLCHVVCTQPRRIAAVSVAERVARERGSCVDESGTSDVGYSIRLDHKLPRAQGSILFCTTGVLLQRLQNEPLLADVSHLLIDEVHERDCLCDFLLIIVRNLLSTRSDLKVVLMSATIDSHRLAEYFGGCPSLHIPGRLFPVEPFFLEDVLALTGFTFEERRGQQSTADEPFSNILLDYTRELRASGRYSPRVCDNLLKDASEHFNAELIVTLIEHICRANPIARASRGEDGSDAAILVFVSGWDEISKLREAIMSRPLFRDEEYFLVLPLHSAMPTVEQRVVFQRPSRSHCRKIVLATNIAETSVTIDDVVYVIDAGRSKVNHFGTSQNAQNATSSGGFDACVSLSAQWISRANGLQRRGRAGRVRAGQCYHLMSAARWRHLHERPVPEVLRCPLAELVLQIKALRLGQVKPLLTRALDPPHQSHVDHALQLLRCLHALDDDEQLTPLGFHLARLPVDPQTGRMLLMSTVFSCVDPVLTIAACLAFKQPFYTPLGKEAEVDQVRMRLSRASASDHVTMWNAFNDWRYAANKYRFADTNFLSTSTLRMISKLRVDFMHYLGQLGLVNTSDPCCASLNVNSSNMAVIRTVLSCGLYPQVAVARRHHKHAPVHDRHGSAYIHKNSVNCDVSSIPSPFLVYKLKMRNKSVSLYDTSAVSAYQLMLFADRCQVMSYNTYIASVGGDSADSALQDARAAGDREEGDATRDMVVLADDLVQFRCSQVTARCFQLVRREFSCLVENIFTSPAAVDWNCCERRLQVLRLIVQLMTRNDISVGGHHARSSPLLHQTSRHRFASARSRGFARRHHTRF